MEILKDAMPRDIVSHYMSFTVSLDTAISISRFCDWYLQFYNWYLTIMVLARGNNSRWCETYIVSCYLPEIAYLKIFKLMNRIPKLLKIYSNSRFVNPSGSNGFPRLEQLPFGKVHLRWVHLKIPITKWT